MRCRRARVRREGMGDGEGWGRWVGAWLGALVAVVRGYAV